MLFSACFKIASTPASLICGIFSWRCAGSRLFHQVFIVQQARGVIQKISDGDRLPIVRKIREDIGKPVFVAQLAVMHQQHDRHGSELLGAGGEAKVGVSVDLGERTQVGHAVPTLKFDLAVLENKHRCTGSASGTDPRKYSVNLLGWHRIGGHASLAASAMQPIATAQ